MNINEYIASGIVESYVLGLAGEEDAATFEQMCLQYPEVREAREQFEILLEKQQLAQAVAVPAEVRSKIFAQIEVEASQQAGSNAGSATIKELSPSKGGSPVIRLKWLRSAAAASILLLAASVALNIYFFNRYNTTRAQYQELLARNTEMAGNQKVMQTRLDNYEQLLASPAMIPVKMAGTNVPNSPAPQSMAIVYWDSQSKDVYLMASQMPVPASDKQYQLWAIVDGKPVDAGVFDVSKNQGLVKMKHIPRAQAFAVTLEKRGGSSVPTLDQMYVMGTAAG